MRFGVISTAAIGVDDVIPAIRASDHEVTAIASRDATRADRIADQLDIPRSYGSYDALLEDDDLDAVYIPLPNGLHAEWIRRAADAGRHVLCEKPLTGDAEETAAVFEYCEARGVTLMEAFMYRFHPRTERAVELVRDELGTVAAVQSAFTFRMPEGADDLTAITDGLRHVEEGETVTAHLPVGAVHVFDAESGEALHNRRLDHDEQATARQ